MKRILLILLVISKVAMSTHNRAGEIIYKYLYGYTYEITLITYTYRLSEANTSRTTLPMQMGDGNTIEIPRINIVYLPDDYQKNTYKALYEYNGPGSYYLVMEDPNRNLGIVNIEGSVDIPFAIKTRLNIDPILGNNNTPTLLNPPIDKAAVGQVFIHNPSAFDSDGDSLSYKLSVCFGQNGEPIKNYRFPDTEERFYINERTGDLIWDSPTVTGNFNVAIIIEEWRSGVKIGQIIRDLQIDVYETENNPPEIEEIPDLCVYAGETVEIQVRVSDPDGDAIRVSATGAPFEVDSELTFPQSTVSSPGTVTFLWNTSCNLVREQPYQVVFKAEDVNDEVSLVDMEYVNVKIIGHPPQIESLSANLNSIAINWSYPQCSNVSRVLVYRSITGENITIEECETGLPRESSYELVSSLAGSLSSTIDTNGGRYLTQGYSYCYRLIAEYADGALSYVGNAVCESIQPGLPFLTNVTIDSSSLEDGAITVRWHKPIPFDTSKYPGPYSYTLERSANSLGLERQVLMELPSLDDTVYTDVSLNTENVQFTYYISLNGTKNGEVYRIGTSQASTSLFLKAISRDRAIELVPAYSTPWNNVEFIYYRFDSISGFTMLGASSDALVDTGLVNNAQYCYYAVSKGVYAQELYPDTLINYSQIACSFPQDTTPPKPPILTVTQFCANDSYVLDWRNTESKDSVSAFNIYYKDCNGASLKLLTTVNGNVRRFEHLFADSSKTMNACYAITAVDDNNNESLFSNDTCLSGCVKYSLPNAFTPNGDESNEIFTPFPYKFVQKVDFQVFNSWGQFIWSTDNPNLNWLGETNTGLPVSNGVYYYVCDVYEYWLTCEFEPRTLLGFIHILGADKTTTPVKSNEE